MCDGNDHVVLMETICPLPYNLFCMYVQVAFSGIVAEYLGICLGFSVFFGEVRLRRF